MPDIYDQALIAYEIAKLPLPPIPEVLHPRLKEISKLTYSTLEGDLFPTIIDVLDQKTLQDQVSVAYVGHGINSYSLRYHLVYRGLIMAMEVFIGGGLADVESNSLDARMRFHEVDQLIALIEKQAGQREIIYIQEYHFSEKNGWVMLDPDKGMDGLSAGNWIQSEQPVRAVIAALSESE